MVHRDGYPEVGSTTRAGGYVKKTKIAPQRHKLFRVDGPGGVQFVVAENAGHAIATLYPPKEPAATEVTETPEDDGEADDEFVGQEGCSCPLCEAAKDGETVAGFFYERARGDVGAKVSGAYGEDSTEAWLWDLSGWGDEWLESVGDRNPFEAFLDDPAAVFRWADEGRIVSFKGAAALAEAISHVSEVVRGTVGQGE